MGQPTTWKERLGDAIGGDLGREIDIFETQIHLRKAGKVDEKVFAETRLRRGVYGQRYDNGQRHDGVRTRQLAFPCGDLTKGPETVWDAPGMMRIKIPMGRLTVAQLDVLAELAEEYSDAILHVTTRQDIQLHFVHIDDTVDLMRRLAAVGITTREACGNSVRNVCACPATGVCAGEPFDTTPYAHALTYFLLGHKDVQDFGRKFKVSFSGCRTEACGLANFHDLGFIAATRTEDGVVQRGFEVRVGGGLGAVPRQAVVLSEFVPEEEILPVTQAICRVFARLGEKQNRSRARFKFLVGKLGLEELQRLVAEERAELPADERWTAYLDHMEAGVDRPSEPAAPLGDAAGSPEFEAWRRTNVRPQRQAGYALATIRLPLGDLTSAQARGLGDLARRYCGDTLVATVEQNLALRWVPEASLPALHADLTALGLGQAGASTIADITACPGTDTCKLGISASRGLAAALERRLAGTEGDAASLRVKASGCFNSCGQHHVADIGLLGVSRNVAGRRVAHFQLVVGGEWTNNAGSYGLAIGAFPSKRVPDLVDRLTNLWLTERQPAEGFKDWVARVGKGRVRDALEDLKPVPPYEFDRSYYVDWGDAREYTTGDMGVGECAGEVVSLTDFGLAAAEREVFEAQLQLEAGNAAEAAGTAVRAMLTAARALISHFDSDIRDDRDAILAAFRTRLHDTKLFWDPFAGPKFSNYLLNAQTSPVAGHAEAHHQIEEAQLFVEAAHACWNRIGEQAQAAPRP